MTILLVFPHPPCKREEEEEKKNDDENLSTINRSLQKHFFSFFYVAFAQLQASFSFVFFLSLLFLSVLRWAPTSARRSCTAPPRPLATEMLYGRPVLKGLGEVSFYGRVDTDVSSSATTYMSGARFKVRF